MTEEQKFINKKIQTTRYFIKESKERIKTEQVKILKYENEIKKIQDECKHIFKYDGVHECTICNYIGEL